MSAVVRIKPHPSYGGIPFDKEVKFDTGAIRAMVSEDLIYLFGTMEEAVPLPMVYVSGQELRCTGLVEFFAEFAGSSCNVSAWVSPSLQGEIIFGYQTLMDLGFMRTNHAATEETYPGAEFTVDNTTRIPGAKATEEIPPVLMPLFQSGWIREVAYRQANQNKCEIYYIPPGRGGKKRSRKDINKYFENVPNESLSSLNFSFTKRPLGLNNQQYEIVRLAKQQGVNPPPPSGYGVPEDDSIVGVFHDTPGDIVS